MKLVRFSLVLLVWGTLGAPIAALAHAIPEHASPPIDGVVPSVPANLEIWFTEEVDAGQLTVLVIGPGGKRVDNNDAALDLLDPERRRVTVSLRTTAGPGTYIVQWHSASTIDQDAADGSYRFTVDPSATPAAATPAAATPTTRGVVQSTGDATATEPSPDPADDSFAQLWPLLLLTSLVVPISAWAVRRRRRRGVTTP